MIELAELSHTYRAVWRRSRPVRALDGVSLRIPPGSTLGLVGVNGAAKTTLLRVLLGYLRPSAGEATIRGEAPRRYAERHGIGYVPERVAIPSRWTVEGALRAYALLGNMDAQLEARIEEALQRLGLEEFRSRRVGALSKGNLQRLAIAQALLCDRDLLVLDEPTDGLDPVWIARLRDLITDWRAADSGRVVLIASHNLPFLERTTDRVVVLHAGRLIGNLSMSSDLRGASLEETFLRLVVEASVPT